jgi:hypothetical protein
MKPNRIAAIICWIITVAFTAVFFHTIGELDILVSVALGIVLQAILTIGERPLWRWALKRANGRFALMAVGLTLVDGILNAAGMYNNVPKLSSSGVGLMLSDAFSLPPTIGKQAAFGIALFIGVIVAGLPEYLWELE